MVSIPCVAVSDHVGKQTTTTTETATTMCMNFPSSTHFRLESKVSWIFRPVGYQELYFRQRFEKNHSTEHNLLLRFTDVVGRCSELIQNVRPRDWGSISGKDTRFFLLHSVQTGSGVHPAFLSNGYRRWSGRGVKRATHICLVPWPVRGSYIHSPLCLVAWFLIKHRDNCTFIIYFLQHPAFLFLKICRLFTRV